MAFVSTSGYQGQYGDSSGAKSFTFSTLPTAGNTLVLGFSSFNGAGGPGVLSVTDNKGSTWSVTQFEYSSVGINNRKIGFALITVPSGWTAPYIVTVTAGVAYSSIAFVVNEESGLTASPLDQIDDNAAAATTTVVLASGVTAQAAERVFTLIDIENWTDANIVAPSGFTLRGSNDLFTAGPPFGFADMTVAATGAQSPVWAFDSSPIAEGLVFTLRLSSSVSVSNNSLSGGGYLPFGDYYSPVVSWSQAPAATASSGNSFTVTATAVDDVGIATFVLRKNGVTVASSTTSAVSYVYSVGSDSGTVQWKAITTDTAGHVSELTASTAISNDTTPPVITLTVNDNSIGSVSEQATLTAVASDATGIVNVKFYRGSPGSGTLLSTVSTAPYRHILSFTRADNGSISYYAVAVDAAGNQTSSDVVTVAVAIPDSYSITVLEPANLVGHPGGTLTWRVLLLLNNVEVTGASILAVSADSDIALIDSGDELVVSIIDGTEVIYPVLGSDAPTLLLGTQLWITANGVATIGGSIPADATEGQTTTVTFTYGDVSVTVTVTVSNDPDPSWVTVYRDTTTWVKVNRNE